MRFKYVLLICAVATLAGAQATTNLGYSNDGMPATPVLPAFSPLIATPVVSSSPAGAGASNGTGANMVGATNATAGNIAGASNATGSNIAGASNSTLSMVSGAGTPDLNVPTYAETPAPSPFGPQRQAGMQQELSPQGPVYLEFGAMRSDSAFDRFGAEPLTLAEASRLAKARSPHDVRIYTNADIERVRGESGVRVPARVEGHPEASSRP
jgi:hypothetical protein